MRLDERHRSGHTAEEDVRDRLGRRLCGCRAVPVGERVGIELAEALDERVVLDEGGGSGGEELSPFGIDRLRRGEVLREKLLDEARVGVFELRERH
jgi:hypothetical protein